MMKSAARLAAVTAYLAGTLGAAADIGGYNGDDHMNNGFPGKLFESLYVFVSL